jgi:hypothetical protein
MRYRRYLGLALGVIATLSLATSVAASTIGPNTVSLKNIGWNSEIFVKASNGNISHQIHHCVRKDGDTSITFDLMHHWFALPSTGTQTVSYPCQNNAAIWNFTWTNRAAADYSVEYNGRPHCTKFSCSDSRASFTYKIIY